MESQKHVILFDLDGVLVDTESMHLKSLTQAIKDITNLPHKDFVHFVVKDGTSTTQKLHYMQSSLGTNFDLKAIDARKQEIFVEMVKDIESDPRMHRTLSRLRAENIMGVVSNTRRSNALQILHQTGYDEYFDVVVTPSPLDGLRPKPYSDMYLFAMKTLGGTPKTTTIVEDSPAGYEAAVKTGATVLLVETVNQVPSLFYGQ